MPRDERDITDSMAFYRKIFQQSTIGMAVYDASGQCIDANDAIGTLIGADRERVLLQNYYHIESWKKFGLLDTALDALRDNIEKHLERYTESTFGRHIIIDYRFIPFTVSDQEYLLLIVSDITEKKRAESALMQAKNDLDRRVQERTAELNDALKKIKRDEKELMERKTALELLNRELMETNQAVSVLARNIDKEKESLERKVYEICSGKLMPILKKLQKDAYCKKREADLELVLNYLNEIVHETPIVHKITSHLTEQEMRVAMLVKNGLTNQKIADSLSLSVFTVKTHRRNIRKKLNIENKNINLASYLKSRLKSGPGRGPRD